jgi:protein-L-isoaspartate(D-aspartate) O-methyltransferase
MVERQIIARGVKDERVLQVMLKVPRHKFIPSQFTFDAYGDHPVPIGYEQTISQPYIVALMTEMLNIHKDYKILEIGAGCGYQTAILAELAEEVHSLEIIQELYFMAYQNIQTMGYSNVYLYHRDGHLGLPENAPYNGIIVAAAARTVPPALVEQLAVGGKLVIPVGSYYQDLILYEKKETGLVELETLPVRFVPLTGHE